MDILACSCCARIAQKEKREKEYTVEQLEKHTYVFSAYLITYSANLDFILDVWHEKSLFTIIIDQRFSLGVVGRKKHPSRGKTVQCTQKKKAKWMLVNEEEIVFC